MSGLLQDFRYASRVLAKSPGFALMAVLALGAGIASNASMFAVADVLAFRPVDFPHLETLVSMVGYTPGEREWDAISAGDFADWKDQTTTLEHVSAHVWRSVNLTDNSGAERLQAFQVTQDFFAAMAVAPERGRVFRPEEFEAGGGRAVVLSHGLWMRRFGSDPAIVGRTIQLDGANYEVAGVMPANFLYPLTAEVWLPLSIGPEMRSMRGLLNLGTVARLKPGVTMEQARAEIAALGQRVSEKYPDTHARRTAGVMFVKDKIVGGMTYSYTMLMLAAAAFVLLIACSNVASLQFVRATARVREVAVRTALGAGRWRIVRQLLCESLLVAAAAAVLGLLLGQWGVEVIKSYMPPEIEKYLPGWSRMTINGAVFAYTMGLAGVAGILAGILPAWQISRGDVNETLKEGGRTGTAGAARHRIRNALIVAEVAAALVLLVGAALMTRGVSLIRDPIANLQGEQVLTMRMTLPESKYAAEKDWIRYFEAALARVRSTRGVESVAVISSLPFSQNRWTMDFAVEGYTPARGEALTANRQSASEDYFRTMRVPLVRGRAFAASDGAEAPQVAILSDNIARRYWPGQDALGKHIRMGTGPWLTVVGVAADVMDEAYDRAPRPTVYQPFRQAPTRSWDLAVRSAGGSATILPGVRAQLTAVDPNLAPFDVRSMRKVIDDALIGLAYVAGILSVCGAIALVLASVGLYSVMAFVVAERTHEIGIRMALGATANDILGMVARQSLVVTGLGLVIGFVAAFALARLLSGLIFGVSASDPVAFVAIPGVLALVAGAATWGPARRATRVEPVVALRHQ
jgi:putative ABC transport system permease protein